VKEAGLCPAEFFAGGLRNPPRVPLFKDKKDEGKKDEKAGGGW